MRMERATDSVFQLPDRLGNEELREDWIRGLSFFDSFPPNTFTFTFADLPDELITPVWMCAEFFSAQRLQWFEAGVHFQYNDNGITLIRDKQPKYQAIGSAILQYITTNLKWIKLAYGMSSLHVAGQFSGMISMPRSLTRGIRGTRLGSGS